MFYNAAMKAQRMEEVMMKSLIVTAIAAVMLSAVSSTRASVCEIVNGSFEDDGLIDNITVKEPNGWDVNMPADKFSGYIHRDWTTTGNYNLTFSSNWTTFAAGDMATVSQEVDLTDVNEVIFDIKLETDWLAWDPSKCIAVLLIDDDIVWDSNSAGLVVSGAYPGQAYEVDNKYRDGNLHKLSLGIRLNTAGKIYQSYITHWDSIRCTVVCGGSGLLAGDFNCDCCVTFADFAMLANHWLEQNPPWLYDLVENGIVDMHDLGVFVDSWLDCSYIEGP
jgi:hypothetical protein